MAPIFLLIRELFLNSEYPQLHLYGLSPLLFNLYTDTIFKIWMIKAVELERMKTSNIF